MITLILTLCVTGLMAESAQRAMTERRWGSVVSSSLALVSLLVLIVSLLTGVLP